MNAPSSREILRWLLGITRPVHGPLYISTLLRILNLSLDIVLFALAGGGAAAIVSGAKAMPIFFWLVVVSLAKATAYYLEQLSGHYVAFKALELLRTAVFSHLWPKAPAVVAHAKSGDILASLTRDVDRIEVVYAHTFAPVVSALVVPPVCVIIVGATVGWPVVWVPAICMIVAVFIVPLAGMKRSARATRQTLEYRRLLAHHVTDSVYGVEEVVGYGRETDRLAQMDEISGQIVDSSRTPAVIAAMRRGVNQFLLLVSVIGVTASSMHAGHSLVLTAALAAGTLRLFEGPRGVEAAVGYLDHSFAAARRLWEISHSPAAVEDGPVIYSPTAAPAVTLSNVTYRYPGASDDALATVSLTVAPGTRTVLLGASGSGKSTIAHLVVRYDDPDDGVVALDGTDIRSWTLDSLRKSVVLVSQRAQLLDTTIRENVTLGAPNATDDEIWAALEAARLADDVQEMPQALDTLVGTAGRSLSGGQAQRLCVARALLMKPLVLILDEFAANLNVDLEREIRMEIARMLPDSTIIEVTHREDAAEGADQVIVLDRGSVVA